jgi:L-asparaginase II
VAGASVDGCGAPLWALPLTALARGLLAVPDRCPLVARAVRDYPDYTGGTTRDVTHVMRAVPGLVAKDGADAVQAMVIEHQGTRYGIALKISDGGERARPVAAAAVLQRLGERAAILDDHVSRPVLGGGRPVGTMRPAAALVAGM